MRRKTWVVMLFGVLVGCGDLGAGRGAEATIEKFVPFSIAIHGATLANHTTSLLLTDAVGPIGCSLTDPMASPGVAVSRVLLTFDDEDPCANRTVPVAAGNVEFTQWSATGSIAHQIAPVGGAVSFARTPAGQGTMRCAVSIVLSFAGGQKLDDMFAFNYDAQESVNAVCLPVGSDVCACEAWQTCNDGNCENPQCLASHLACPSDGSIACCDARAQCDDGQCCLVGSQDCDPNADACCTSCEYSDAAFNKGWHCRN